MLIEFIVGNFRSIKDSVTLSMVAANLVSKDKALDTENVIRVDEDLRLLTSAAIYGANASGKSNLITAVSFMRHLVLNSSRETQSEDRIGVESFRLNTETENEPSFFETVFLLNGKKYRYGFKVNRHRVTAEWLFFVPSSREAKLFERVLDEINVSTRFREGKGIAERTRPNALFLSVVAQFNGEISSDILAWFRRLSVNLGVNDSGDLMLTANHFHQMEDKNFILQFIKDLDLGINDIRSELVAAPWNTEVSDNLKEFQEWLVRVTGNQLPGELPKITTVHRKYDSQGGTVRPEIFELDTQESAGTRRLFGLAFPILDALNRGRVLFIDEIDARLHPLITRKIISLFNSKRTNPNNGQLVFTTHDTNLLSNKLFRRDQIWFTEKDRFGVTHLYSLVELKVRNDASFEEDYIQGRYGAIPFINNDLHLVVGGVDGAE
jgi:AAA15 family ATPase/GTPase